MSPRPIRSRMWNRMSSFDLCSLRAATSLRAALRPPSTEARDLAAPICCQLDRGRQVIPAPVCRHLGAFAGTIFVVHARGHKTMLSNTALINNTFPTA